MELSVPHPARRQLPSHREPQQEISFCPLPSVRFTSGDARNSDHEHFWLPSVFCSWYLRMWYVISHNTAASSTSSDKPPVLQPIMRRISLHTFDLKRKSAFVLVLPYLPLGELKPFSPKQIVKPILRQQNQQQS